MKFSIIVPAFNCVAHIRNCLDSILSQSYKDFEVVVIDDGSTDSTLEILKEYQEKDSRIQIHHFENSGVGLTRRRGAMLSKGDFILFVDSDDTINKDLLSSIYSFLKNCASIPDIIRYQCNIVGDKPGKDHERYNFLSNVEVLLPGLETLKHWSVPGKKYAVYWLFAFNRKVFNQFFTIPEMRCYEDVALIPLLIASAKSVATIDYVGYNYTYQNPTSLTHVRSIEAERSRAYDFFAAYDFAIANFVMLPNVTKQDIVFFYKDYDRRLLGKYESLPDELKVEFKEMLDKRVI